MFSNDSPQFQSIVFLLAHYHLFSSSFCSVCKSSTNRFFCVLFIISSTTNRMVNSDGVQQHRVTFYHRFSMVMCSHKFHSECWPSDLVRWASLDGACCWIPYLHSLYRLPLEKVMFFGCALCVSFKDWAKVQLYHAHMPCWPNGFRPMNDHEWGLLFMLVCCWTLNTKGSTEIYFPNRNWSNCFFVYFCRCPIWNNRIDAIVWSSVWIRFWWRLAIDFLCIRFCRCHLVCSVPHLCVRRPNNTSTYWWKRKEIHCERIVGNGRCFCKFLKILFLFHFSCEMFRLMRS